MVVGPVMQTVDADLDGDGQPETFQAMQDGSTRVIKNSATIWSTQGWIDGWNRSPSDIVLAVGVDVDNDGRQEIVMSNPQNGWTGLLKWSGSVLHCPWASASPLNGPGMSWNRRGSDAFGATAWQGHPAVSINHYEDEWYGTLAWTGNRLELVALWQGGLQVRKFTFLYDMLEVTGEVTEFIPAGTDAPTMTLKVDEGFLSIPKSVSGSDAETFHCETYPDAISIPGGNGVNQINHLVPFEPWPGETYTGKSGTIFWTPPLEVIDAGGGKRQLKTGDRVRVRGRLIIENGHPNGPPPNMPRGVGRPFVELHPFDWRNIQDDSIPSGPDSTRSHTLFMVAPLYEAIEFAKRPNQQFPDQEDHLVFLNTSPAPYHNTVEHTAHFDAPLAPGVTGPVAFKEMVLVNKTGKTIDEIRTITTTATGIVVNARIDAPTDSQVGPFTVASPDELTGDGPAGVLLVKYDVFWQTDKASFVSQNYRTTLIRGSQSNVTVTMSNTGSTTWKSALGYRLGSDNPSDNMVFGLNRVELPNDVPPAGSVTFAFTITVPMTSSDVNMQWRMVRDGMHWFGQQSDLVTITVGSNAECVSLAVQLNADTAALAEAEDELASLNPSDSGFHAEVASLSASIHRLHAQIASIQQQMIAKGC